MNQPLTNEKPEAFEDSISADESLIKNTHRIDEIVSKMSVHKEVTLLSSTMAKIVRKDWNIVCAKMYVFSRNRELQGRIADALAELHWQINDLVESPAVSLFKFSAVSWLEAKTYPVKIVSAEAASWLRAILTIDNCVAKMLTAEREGHITKQQRIRSLADVSMTYTNFKFIAMNTTPPQKGGGQENIFA